MKAGTASLSAELLDLLCLAASLPSFFGKRKHLLIGKFTA